MKGQARAKRKSPQRPARAARRPALRAAKILERAGLPANCIPRVVRQLRRVFGTGATERPGAGEPAVASRARPRVMVRVRSQTTTEFRAASSARSLDEAGVHFERGLALEDSDLEAAREAYAAALATHDEHLEARINLGRLMHLNGELEAAEDIYRAAKQGSALLAFNLALVLEDLGRDEEAVAAYRESLALDPTMHEAHLNLGFLYERSQSPREALRHMLAFRRGAPEY